MLLAPHVRARVLYTTKKTFVEYSGLDPNAKINKQTVSWFGDTSEVLLIDIPGFGDFEHRDNLIITVLEKHLKEIRFVNTFILVLDGQNQQFDESLQLMMTQLRGMLTDKYLYNTLVVFTRWPLDYESHITREKLGENEQAKSQNFNQKISELYNFDTKTHPIPCFFLDNGYAAPDMTTMTGEELEKFYSEIEKLRAAVEKMPEFDFELRHSKIDKIPDSTIEGPLTACENVKIGVREITEDQKKFEIENMKEIHKLLKGLDRRDYTVHFTKELRRRFPNRNCLIIDNKWHHTLKLNNSTHMHFEKSAMFGSHGFEVFLFDDGFVKKGGDGGHLNWAYEGCFNRVDDYTLEFHIN